LTLPLRLGFRRATKIKMDPSFRWEDEWFFSGAVRGTKRLEPDPGFRRDNDCLGRGGASILRHSSESWNTF
jgi:hypothetical protein